MKNLLLMVAVAVFAIAGAAQKEQPKKSDTKKTAVVKKTPTPAKKPTVTAKKTADKKTPAKQAATNTKKPTPKPGPTQKKPTPVTSDATASKAPAKATPKPAAVKRDPKADLEKALALEKPDEKIAAIVKFLSDHPRSELRPRAFASLTAARVSVAERKFEAGEREAALALYRKAIKDAPVPYPEKLFTEVISKMPPSLYYRGEAAAALEIAAAIETNSSTSLPQLLALAGFHMLTENGDGAKRLAEAAIKIDEGSSAAYQVIAMANRLNFDLEASAAAFEKALELDPESVSARRGLADMKRALSKPDEALVLYDALIAKDADDQASRSGRILSLFEAGKRTDAESELSRAIEANPSNVPLIAGAAYWYAANGDSTKAIDLAGKAIAVEPRFIWSHIALSRAFLAEGRFSDAELALLKARKFGNFSTLEYEIALTRFAGGFYREAVEELQKSFTIKDGMVATKLGRRIERAERSFPELLASERRASLLAPRSADKQDAADTLKALFEFKSLLAEASPDPAKAAELADAFAKGSDKMRYHRQIYAANELLEKKVAPVKALELSRSAVSSLEDGLSVAVPAAPILAGELYANRVAAMASDKYILVPDVTKQTLSAIARGRIEEIAGWSLLQQGNNVEAVVRLRRAVGILPEKSAWWRSSTWRLGLALEADGKDKEALEMLAKSYQAADPEPSKYGLIEAVYKRVNGGSDGLEALVGANPAKPVEKKSEEKPVVTTEARTESEAPKTEEKTEVKDEPKSAPMVNDEKLPEPKKAEVKDDAKAASSVNSEKPTVEKDAEKKTEEKIEIKEEPKPTLEVTSEKPAESTKKDEKSIQKPLFEPVVIKIPKPDTPSESESTKKQQENSAKPVSNKSSSEDPSKEQTTSGRPRVVEGKEVKADAEKPCSISVSQENISLIGGGGSVGLLVGVDTHMDMNRVEAVSSSSSDVEVTKEPAIAGGVKNRAFYIVRSLTSSSGIYKVSFIAPCGRKEVSVRVR